MQLNRQENCRTLKINRKGQIKHNQKRLRRNEMESQTLSRPGKIVSCSAVHVHNWRYREGTSIQSHNQ